MRPQARYPDYIGKVIDRVKEHPYNHGKAELEDRLFRVAKEGFNTVGLGGQWNRRVPVQFFVITFGLHTAHFE